VVATAGDPQRREGESVWSRIEREERNYAARARRPLNLMFAGVLLLNVINLARLVGVDPPLAAVIIFAVVGSTMAVVGFVKSRRTRKRMGL
jgi:hypothetical protein